MLALGSEAPGPGAPACHWHSRGARHCPRRLLVGRGLGLGGPGRRARPAFPAAGSNRTVPAFPPQLPGLLLPGANLPCEGGGRGPRGGPTRSGPGCPGAMMVGEAVVGALGLDRPNFGEPQWGPAVCRFGLF